jgi:hypothetical protein
MTTVTEYVPSTEQPRRHTLHADDCVAILREYGWRGMNTGQALEVLLAHADGARLSPNGDLMGWMWEAGAGVTIPGPGRRA